jgi:signal transduction histidine kinase
MESKVKRLEGSITDITERKQMEEELKRHTEHLEEEVRQRTNELIQSEKMAAIGLLLTGVAHEINNPLGYINSNSEIINEHLQSLKENYYDDQTLQIINEICELIQTNIMGVNRIITITKSLRRFAMPDKGQIALANINQGIKDTLLILHNQLKHRIEVIEDYNEVPNVKCNIGQLNQVFMNLILNSSQAMDKGKIWIKTWSENNKIHIEIKDNGKGIDTEKIKNIFDPFFTTKKSGTGLGLSLSYRIIKDHNGNIKVESKVGEGTKMLIELPLEV